MNAGVPMIPDVAKWFMNLVEAVSFSQELQKLRRELNTRIDSAESASVTRPKAPGAARWFRKRRITIAEAYLMVVRDLESRQSKARLRALRLMIDASFHAKTIDMPLNTARLQMALMKDAVKCRHNKRRQLELLHDFSRSSHGQHQVIRKLCDELGIVELPETGKPLSEMDVGWDEHVHDTATSGRKNPTQLLIDAFIKGISSLTIAYDSITSVEMMEEAVDAGRILGIKVLIGLEFSLQAEDRRYHFMAILPVFKRGKDVARWLDANSGLLAPIFNGLEENHKNRMDAVARLIHNFNRSFRKSLNEGYPEQKLYRVPKLSMKKLESFIPLASINRMHLGEFLHSRFRPVLLNRLLLLKVQREKARADFHKRLLSEWDFRIIDERYLNVRREFLELNPENLRLKYFTNPKIGDYQTVFDNLPHMRQMLSSAGCKLKILHPLEHGLERAKRLLSSSCGIIDEVEIYNMQDSVNRNPEEILEFAAFVNELNAKNRGAGKPAFMPVCGSDSTGRNPRVPGMGFIRRDRIRGQYGNAYTKRHVALPSLVSAMVEAAGVPVDGAMVAAAPVILSMGKIVSMTRNIVGDETGTATTEFSIARVWRYLNPGLVNLIYAFVGFTVARSFIGDFYALLWLAITGFRNSVADLVASKGSRLSGWSLRSVNFDNVARSLFWTGFSVPILGFVKAKFDVLWPWGQEGVLFDAVKFFFISFANGIYLATHNTLRGFDRSVVRANFFRSVIAWPFATVFAPVGNLLGLPSIVQAKIWSDFVAGFVEGGNKYLKILKLRRRDLTQIIPRIVTDDQEERFTALLDLLFLFREEPRTESSMRAVLDPDYKPMGILKLAKSPQVCPFLDLYAVIMDESTDHALVDHILTRYEPEMAVELAGLVATWLPLLREWIVGIARKVTPSDSSVLDSGALVTEASLHSPAMAALLQPSLASKLATGIGTSINSAIAPAHDHVSEGNSKTMSTYSTQIYEQKEQGMAGKSKDDY